MEHIDYCVTCLHFRRNARAGIPIDAGQRMWCARHDRLLRGDLNSRLPICCEYCPEEGDGSEWLHVIKRFPRGEIWSFDLYLPSEKLIEIKDLPLIDPLTGDLKY